MDITFSNPFCVRAISQSSVEAMVRIWLESLYHRALLSFIKRWSDRSTLSFCTALYIHAHCCCLLLLLLTPLVFFVVYFHYARVNIPFSIVLFCTRKKVCSCWFVRSFYARMWLCVCCRTEIFPRLDDKHESRSYGRRKMNDVDYRGERRARERNVKRVGGWRVQGIVCSTH